MVYVALGPGRLQLLLEPRLKAAHLGHERRRQLDPDAGQVGVGEGEPVDPVLCVRENREVRMRRRSWAHGHDEAQPVAVVGREVDAQRRRLLIGHEAEPVPVVEHRAELRLSKLVQGQGPKTAADELRAVVARSQRAAHLSLIHI